MRILVVGAGAMGSLMAARFALAGRDVTLFGRPSPHLDAMQKHGLTLEEADGTRQTVPLQSTSAPADANRTELVVVLVKAWATAEAVAPLQGHLPPDALVLTLQNGLGNAAALRSVLQREDGSPLEVILGVTTQAALRIEPGVVRHTGAGITAIGRRKAALDYRLREIADLFAAAGLPAVAVEDIDRWVWRKLAINAAINPLTALAETPNRAISADPDLRAAAADLAREVAAVANARGIKLDPEDVVAAVGEVARATGENRSSMLHDLEAGSRTEVDAINGAVIAEADRLGVPVPANRLMAALIRARERRAGVRSQD